MTKIKICGLKRMEDIDYVNEFMPDYVGFVFAESKRQVTLEKAKKLIERLNKSIKTVGVFVDEPIDSLTHIAESLNLDVLQFHGSEDEIYFSKLKEFKLWKSVSIKVDLGKSKFDKQEEKDDLINIYKNKDENNSNFYNVQEYQKDIDKLKKYHIEAIVLDSSIKGAQGGTGVSFDWQVIPKLTIDKRLILAGGLNADNVSEAVKEVRPFAVDVSSGVETEGLKDFNKIKTFIEKVRNIK